MKQYMSSSRLPKRISLLAEPVCQEPHGFLDQAQENPDLEEQPESAPEGMDVPPCPIRKLEAEMVFFTFKLPHFLHLTVSPSEEVTSTSK